MHAKDIPSWLGTLLRQHRVQLALSLRATIAALASYVLAQMAQLPLPLWAVLTALIVTQMSVGKSLKATSDYLIGTLGGAVYGGIIGVLIPHPSEISFLMVLAIGVAPLAFVAAINPKFSSAPVTAAIVLLIPLMTHSTQIASAVDRVLEVALGGATGFMVSYLLLPSNAHRMLVEAAAQTLDQMANVLRELLAGAAKGFDIDSLHEVQDGLGRAINNLGAVAAEAEQERSTGIAEGPETGPLLRTLLRLRHDLVMIGRTAVAPLSPAITTRLALHLAEVGDAFAAYLRASGAALKVGGGPASLEHVQSALGRFSAEFAAIRRDGLTRNLPDEAAERFFTLGFALEQMHNNFRDLQRFVAESAAPSES